MTIVGLVRPRAGESYMFGVGLSPSLVSVQPNIVPVSTRLHRRGGTGTQRQNEALGDGQNIFKVMVEQMSRMGSPRRRRDSGSCRRCFPRRRRKLTIGCCLHTCLRTTRCFALPLVGVMLCFLASSWSIGFRETSLRIEKFVSVRS